MFVVRTYRRPKKDVPILEMKLCDGCVTPKMCRKTSKCEVRDELEQEKQHIIEKIHGSKKEKDKIQKNKSNTDKSKIIRTSKGRN
jgi:hypothetical protein